MFWTSLIVWAVGTLIMELVRPKPDFEDQRPAGLGDFNFPTATEGRPVPIIWGRVRVDAPNIIWYGDKRDEAITEHVTTGMFSSEDVVIGYRYYIGMVFAICRGPGVNLHTLFIGDKAFRSVGITNPSGDSGQSFYMTVFALLGFDRDNRPSPGLCRFYSGSYTQDVNAYLSTRMNPAIPFRGTSILVWEGGAISPSTNIQPWGFAVSRVPDGLNLATFSPGAEEPYSDAAAIPNVLYEILTDTEWGLSISPGEVDAANFRTAAVTLAAEGNGFCMVVDNVMPVEDIIRELERQMDGTLYYDRVNALWKISLVRDDYDPGTLVEFDETNIVALENFTRQTWEETVNQVRVPYNDRHFDYFQRTYAMAQDIANTTMQGYSVSAEVRYPGVTDASLANSLAWRDMRVLSYPLAKCTLKLNRKGFSLIPGQPFKLSWARLGIEGVVFRAQKINPGNLDSPYVTVYAVEDIFSTGVGTFSDPPGTTWDETAVSAVPVALASADTLAFEAPRQIVAQDPYSSELQPRVWAGGRWPGEGVTGLAMYSKAGSFRPLSSSYELDVSVVNFLLMGTLDVSISAYAGAATRPATSYNIDVDSTPDDLSSLVINGDRTLVADLKTIIKIDDEYIGFEQLTSVGGGVYRLARIHRGLFNSVQAAHSAGADVWFIGQTGGSLTRHVLAPAEDEMDLQLRSYSLDEELEEGDCNTEQLSLSLIWRQPLPPRDPVLNGVYADTTSINLDASYTAGTGRTGEDARAVQAQITARAWRIDDPTQDHQLPLSSPAYLDDSPVLTFSLELDPTGTPVSVPSVDAGDSETPVVYLLRNEIIKAMGPNATIPGTARLTVTPKHTPPEIGSQVTGVPLVHNMTVVSTLQSDAIRHGGLSVSTPGTAVIYSETGNYSFDIYTALPSSGILEASVNGGAYATIVSAASTTGILAITSGDSVVLRFTQAPTADQFFSIAGPTAETGHGVLRA